jgi:hypothetical protein
MSSNPRAADKVATQAADKASDLVQQLVADAYDRGRRHERELALSPASGSSGEVPADEMTVAAAREQLVRQLPDGVDCPVCRQRAKQYARPLTSVAVRALAALYAAHGRTAGHLPTIAADRMRDVAHQGGYLSLSQHWGLMVPEAVTRPDGGRGGFWSVTQLGEAFLRGEKTVQKYALIYNGELLELQGEPVTARSLLGEAFDYSQIAARAEATGGGQLVFLPDRDWLTTFGAGAINERVSAVDLHRAAEGKPDAERKVARAVIDALLDGGPRRV